MSATLRLTAEHVLRFADASGDRNPLHVDEPFARSTSYGRCIAHGALVTIAALVVLYGASLPASYSYVAFMKVERASYLKLRMDWLFSIYVVFLVAVMARYLWRLAYLARGREPGEADPTKPSSGL